MTRPRPPIYPQLWVCFVALLVGRTWLQAEENILQNHSPRP